MSLREIGEQVHGVGDLPVTRCIEHILASSRRDAIGELRVAPADIQGSHHVIEEVGRDARRSNPSTCGTGRIDVGSHSRFCGGSQPHVPIDVVHPRQAVRTGVGLDHPARDPAPGSSSIPRAGNCGDRNLGSRSACRSCRPGSPCAPSTTDRPMSSASRPAKLLRSLSDFAARLPWPPRWCGSSVSRGRHPSPHQWRREPWCHASGPGVAITTASTSGRARTSR